MTTQTTTPAPKQINLARPDDTEVITFGAFEISCLASELTGVIDTLSDVSTLLSMIYRGKLDHHQAKAMARAFHCTIETWGSNLHGNLDQLNAGLKQTNFGEVQA